MDKVPWEEIIKERRSNFASFLSLRGKNLNFLSAVADALQLDSIRPKSWAQVKRACTAEAVRKIHEAIPWLWPDRADLRRILHAERDQPSALYVGIYELDHIIRSVTRHSVYTDRILLFDPFVDARTVRAEFSPIEEPELHRTSTLHSLALWYDLMPWIGAGLVHFIRRPSDFDPQLFEWSVATQEARYRKHPELQDVRGTMSDDFVSSAFGRFQDYFMLATPDEILVDHLRRAQPNVSDGEISLFLRDLAARRQSHPYFLESAMPKEGGSQQLLLMTTGSNYSTARLTAQVTGSYLLTDIPTRWREIEIDRKESGVSDSVWEPFAKAFQGLDFTFLNEVPLAAALRLRQSDRLSSMRVFLQKIWRSGSSADEFSAANVLALTDQLKAEMQLADKEWRLIRREMGKWATGTVATLAGVGTAIGTGTAHIVAGAAAIGAAYKLQDAWSGSRSLLSRHPAAFFVQLERRAH